MSAIIKWTGPRMRWTTHLDEISSETVKKAKATGWLNYRRVYIVKKEKEYAIYSLNIFQRIIKLFIETFSRQSYASILLKDRNVTSLKKSDLNKVGNPVFSIGQQQEESPNMVPYSLDATLEKISQLKKTGKPLGILLGGGPCQPLPKKEGTVFVSFSQGLGENGDDEESACKKVSSDRIHITGDFNKMELPKVLQGAFTYVVIDYSTRKFADPSESNSRFGGLSDTLEVCVKFMKNTPEATLYFEASSGGMPYIMGLRDPIKLQEHVKDGNGCVLYPLDRILPKKTGSSQIMLEIASERDLPFYQQLFESVDLVKGGEFYHFRKGRTGEDTRNFDYFRLKGLKDNPGQLSMIRVQDTPTFKNLAPEQRTIIEQYI